MATTSIVQGRLPCLVVTEECNADTSSQESHGARSCLTAASVMTHSNSNRKPRQCQQRYAPYHCSTRLQRPQQQQEQQQQMPQNADGSDCPVAQRRRLMLRLAINMANSSLESTLQHFNTACHAHPGSAAAISALDAAEAAMAATTRMTSVASILARRCLQSSSRADADPLLQQAQQLALQALCPAGQQPVLMQQGVDAALAAVAAQAPLGMQWFAPLQQQQQQEEEEDVEEGEEVSSSGTRSSSAME